MTTNCFKFIIFPPSFKIKKWLSRKNFEDFPALTLKRLFTPNTDQESYFPISNQTKVPTMRQSSVFHLEKLFRETFVLRNRSLLDTRLSYQFCLIFNFNKIVFTITFSELQNLYSFLVNRQRYVSGIPNLIGESKWKKFV